MMDLDELQSVQSRERQTDSLQQLRESFYRDAAEYIHRLEDERDSAAERADDPWNSPEVGRLNDDIDTAEQTVEAVYERRVGKIVKMASLAAADMPTENEGLTAEEQSLFETLVDAIEHNREQVFAILDGESPPDAASTGHESADAAETGSDETVDRSPAPPDESAGAGASDLDPDPGSGSGSGLDGTDRPDRVDAADVMGGGTDARSQERDVPGESTPGPERDPPENPTDDPAGKSSGDATAQSETAEAGDVERATVKITSDVGEIFGVDERAYDLTADDVVTLPEANAGPLVERDAAERLD